jgi:hypothetical protein
MVFRVGIENNNEGVRSIAWVLEHPGCFVYGTDQAEAMENLPSAIRAYADWIASHGTSWLETAQIETSIEGVWTAYCIDKSFERLPGYRFEDNEINAWFQHDWKPLTAADIQRGQTLLSWTRQDLQHVLHPLTETQWAHKAEGERRDVAGIVKHIADAEWWYVDRLGLAFPRKELPAEPLERLERSRAQFNQVLATLDNVDKVVGKDGEIWSPRKMLRRAVWHERDHTEHIRKLI